MTDPLRGELMSAGTHPFARWAQQKVTDKQRYTTLIDRTQWWGRQMLIYGVHVHVGIEDRAKVLPLQRAMLTTFAHLQSLSASSPRARLLIGRGRRGAGAPRAPPARGHRAPASGRAGRGTWSARAPSRRGTRSRSASSRHRTRRPRR